MGFREDLGLLEFRDDGVYLNGSELRFITSFKIDTNADTHNLDGVGYSELEVKMLVRVNGLDTKEIESDIKIPEGEESEKEGDLEKEVGVRLEIGGDTFLGKYLLEGKDGEIKTLL